MRLSVEGSWSSPTNSTSSILDSSESSHLPNHERVLRQHSPISSESSSWKTTFTGRKVSDPHFSNRCLLHRARSTVREEDCHLSGWHPDPYLTLPSRCHLSLPDFDHMCLASNRLTRSIEDLACTQLFRYQSTCESRRPRDKLNIRQGSSDLTVVKLFPQLVLRPMVLIKIRDRFRDQTGDISKPSFSASRSRRQSLDPSLIVGKNWSTTLVTARGLLGLALFESKRPDE